MTDADAMGLFWGLISLCVAAVLIWVAAIAIDNWQYRKSHRG